MDSILTWAREVLVTTPKRWIDLTLALSPDLLSRPPEPHEWSALECLQHLVQQPAMLRSYTSASAEMSSIRLQGADYRS